MLSRRIDYNNPPVCGHPDCERSELSLIWIATLSKYVIVSEMFHISESNSAIWCKYIAFTMV